jgi:hypothetical protein
MKIRGFSRNWKFAETDGTTTTAVALQHLPKQQNIEKQKFEFRQYLKET